MTFSPGVYMITNVGSGTALQLNGLPVQGWETLEGVARLPQLWHITPVDASKTGDDAKYVARNVSTNKCLDLSGGDPTNGTEVIGWDYHEADNQHWYIKKTDFATYWRLQNAKTKTLLDLAKNAKANGVKVQGWEGNWNDGSLGRGWVMSPKSLSGRQIKTILDQNPPLKNKTVIEYPDRTYLTLDKAFFEDIWAKSGLANVKPRPPLFDAQAYEKVFKGLVISYANENIQADGFDILMGTASCIEDVTHNISSWSVTITGRTGLLDSHNIVFFNPQTGKAYDNLPKNLKVRSIVI